MAPSRRLSNGGTPGQQRSISSFFSPGTPSNPSTTKPQRSISSFFMPELPSTPASEGKQKPVLCIGHLQHPSTSPSENPLPYPKSPAEKRMASLDSSMWEASLPSSKRLRVESKPALDLPCNESVGCDPEGLVGKKLKVYWPIDEAWYEGRIKSYNNISGRHAVLYDDGEEESLLLAEEKIEWMENENKINAPLHRFRRLRKLSEKEPTNGNTLNGKDDISEDVSEIKIPNCVPGTGPLSSCRFKRAATQSKTNFNIESEESAGDDDSDEDWGKNVKNADATDDSEDEEDGGLETEEEIGGKRKRTQRVTKQTARRKNKSIKEKNNDSYVKTFNPNPLLQGATEATDVMPSKRLDFLQETTSVMKILREDDDNGFWRNQKSRQENMIGSEMDITLTGEAAERFGSRTSEKFTFLCKGRRDAAGKYPGDPEYNPRTLYLPPEFLKGLSGGQRQWWEFKAKHMDKVLFFKMGKFYELFEMDAHIAASELDLQYMKGEQPHCGFPEKNFTENVEKLARKGYRVLVVEQTETPDQLEQRRKETGTKDKVVKREICAVITKGTMTEGAMLATCPDAAYLMAITERHGIFSKDMQSGSVIGVCIADASTSRFMLGQFSDNSARSRLRSMLSEIRPVELIKPSGILSDETERALREQTRNPLVNNLVPVLEFWDAEKSLIEIEKLYALFRDTSKSENVFAEKGARVYNHSDAVNGEIPDVICELVNAGENGQLALSAFGGCLSYLRQVLLDQSLLSFGKLEILPCSDFVSMQDAYDDKSHELFVSRDLCLVEPYAILDSAALENLEILENNRDGSSSGTLLAQIDHCATAFGKRLLRKWLVRPLKHAESVLERQDAIADIKGIASDSAVKFRKELARLPDMERLLARLYASSEANGRNATRVVLYEDAAKKQLQEFIAGLRGCQSMIQACSSFQSSMAEIRSSLLQHILTPGKGLPDMKIIVEHFQAAFDWSEAEKTGRIVPSEGVDKDYDIANNRVRKTEASLARHLEKLRKYFGSQTGINYVTVGKEQYQIEIPENLQEKVPPEYEARSSRKGFRRYWTLEVKEMLQELFDAQVQREASLKGILEGLIKQFCKHHIQWRELVHVVAEIDVLISLAMASDYFEGQTCRPLIKGSSNRLINEIDGPYLHARGLRHPILASSSIAANGSFVPNDVNLGGGKDAPFILLTGPNMGGKSTLLRQVCLAVILAQVGADVPAEEFELSPVDRVFVRMGAKDHIMAGQSTFLVELSETASMLSSATRDSLVALDELGRGTATSDGQAIAHAVLKHLAHKTGCRGMFSTHYHHLATDCQNDPNVSLFHMACKVGTRVGDLEEVTFLYKLTPGACPKSYGVNVARLAGMPDIILERAAVKSTEFENRYGRKGIECDGRPLVFRKSKEIKLIQEVVNIVKELCCGEDVTVSKENWLLKCGTKLCCFLGQIIHILNPLGISPFDCPLCSAISTGK